MSVAVTWNCGRWAGKVQSLSEGKKAPCDKGPFTESSCPVVFFWQRYKAQVLHFWESLYA
jgi:hypothetical protein